jgi:hypothetical protein
MLQLKKITKEFYFPVRNPYPGSICSDISLIFKFNLAPVLLNEILRLISSKNSAYQAWPSMGRKSSKSFLSRYFSSVLMKLKS